MERAARGDRIAQARIFHPELFPSRYEGKAWMRYPADPKVNE